MGTSCTLLIFQYLENFENLGIHVLLIPSFRVYLTSSDIKLTIVEQKIAEDANMSRSDEEMIIDSYTKISIMGNIRSIFGAAVVMSNIVLLQ